MQNITADGGVIDVIVISNMAQGSHVGFCVSNTKLPSKCNCRCQLHLKILHLIVCSIVSENDIAIVCWRIGLKLSIYVVISAVHERNKRQIYLWVEIVHTYIFVGDRFNIQLPKTCLLT